MTLRKLAALAGCSHSTVSRVIAGSPRISKETCARVLELARRNEYKPPKNKCVIALISHLANFFPDNYTFLMFQSLAMELHRRQYQVMGMFDHDLRLLNERLTVGAISFSPFYRIAKLWSASYAQPLITMNDYGDWGGNVHSVCSDEKDVILRIVSILIAHGASNIVFFDSGDDTYCRKFRLEGYCSAMEHFGFSPEVVSAAKSKHLEGKNPAALLPAHTNAVILPGENLMAFGDVMKANYPDLLLIRWRFELNHQELCVAQDYHSLALNAVEMLGSVMDKGIQPANRLVPYLFSSSLSGLVMKR